MEDKKTARCVRVVCAYVMNIKESHNRRSTMMVREARKFQQYRTIPANYVYTQTRSNNTFTILDCQLS
ncbi:hypothetical protein Mapa_003754 [Marchantia paleacea]|nr:hypothetical protein Mapa_003754 [Marchantia paleacea]